MANNGRYTEEFKIRVRDAWISGKFSSITKLSESFGLKHPSLVWRWMRDDDWYGYQKKLMEKVEEKKSDKIADMLIRQQKMGQFLQGKGIKVLQEKNEKDINPFIALQMVKEGATLERESAKFGLGENKQAVVNIYMPKVEEPSNIIDIPAEGFD